MFKVWIKGRDKKGSRLIRAGQAWENGGEV